MKCLNLFLGVGACLMLATGCSLLSPGSREPDTIVVRNATGAIEILDGSPGRSHAV